MGPLSRACFTELTNCRPPTVAVNLHPERSPDKFAAAAVILND
jgi:hypothetical protein